MSSFVADRDNLAGLDLGRAVRADRADQPVGAATLVSGLGSEDPATAAIRERFLYCCNGSARARCSMRPAAMPLDRPHEARSRLHRPSTSFRH